MSSDLAVLPPILVGEILEQPFDFSDTLKELSGLTISGASIELIEGDELIDEVDPCQLGVFDFGPGATWKIKGLAVGTVVGQVWLTLSPDGERRSRPWQLEVREAVAP